MQSQQSAAHDKPQSQQSAKDNNVKTQNSGQENRLSAFLNIDFSTLHNWLSDVPIRLSVLCCTLHFLDFALCLNVLRCCLSYVVHRCTTVFVHVVMLFFCYLIALLHCYVVKLPVVLCASFTAPVLPHPCIEYTCVRSAHNLALHTASLCSSRHCFVPEVQQDRLPHCYLVHHLVLVLVLLLLPKMFDAGLDNLVSCERKAIV